MTSNGAQPEIQTRMLKSHPHVPQQQVDRARGQEKLQNIYNIQNRLAGGQEKLQMIERVSVNNIHGEREARKIKQGRETLSEYISLSEIHAVQICYATRGPWAT